MVLYHKAAKDPHQTHPYSEFYMARKKTEATVSTKKTIFDKLSPKAVFAVSAILLVLGIIFTCVSIAPRKTAIAAVENFANKSYFFDDGKMNSDYDGHPIIVTGELTYSENGAVDAILGISVDAPILYRISEMYQWTLEDGKVIAAWSEELIESPDGGHTNPSSYPSNAKSNHYIAEGVSIGDFSISADQLLQLESKTKLTSLPEIDVRGYKTAGDYITNSENLNDPKIGDVRIRYEYVSIDKATFAGKQRSNEMTKFANFEDVPIFLSIDGGFDKSGVISELRARAEHANVWLFVISVIATLAGGFSFFHSMCVLTGYNPSLDKLGKKFASVPHEKVALIHSVVFAVLAFGLTYSLIWADVYEIGIAFFGVLTLIYLALLIPDMIVNMPRPKKKEAEYVPILIKRDEEPTSKKNRR